MEDEYLLSHLEDLYHEMEANSYLTHSAFLSFDEQAAYLELFKQKKREPSSLFLYGGALEAERKMAVFLPYYMDTYKEITQPFCISFLSIQRARSSAKRL